MITSPALPARVDADQVKRAHPVEEIVSRYGIELRPVGRALVGRCPLHADGGRPNLHVYPYVSWNSTPADEATRPQLRRSEDEGGTMHRSAPASPPYPPLATRWPVLAACPDALTWLGIQADLGLAPRTIEAYARGLADYLVVCRRDGIDPQHAGRADVARYVRELTTRPSHRGPNVRALDSGAGLANATLQQRLVAVRLFYDHLVEEGKRATNPVGRGRSTPGRAVGGQRGLVPRLSKLPWIPTDAQWHQLLLTARTEPLRNRLMLALAYDAGLRREELCSLRTDDLDPAHRMVRVRAETTKGRHERAVPYSATTGALLQAYLRERRALSLARGPVFLSTSRRNRAQPITLWTWSKVVRGLALRAGVPRFSTHTLRHLCLTDLARAGWELHAIATFAGHRNPQTTLQYIHLSGRDLAAKLASGMAQVHAWRLAQVGELLGETPC